MINFLLFEKAQPLLQQNMYNKNENKIINNKGDRALLRLKMEDLGLSPKVPEETESVIAKPAQIKAPVTTAISAPTATSISQPNAEPKTTEKTKALAKTTPTQAQSTDITQTQKSEPKQP